jgi:hypothetical protein
MLPEYVSMAIPWMRFTHTFNIFGAMVVLEADRQGK